MKPSRDLLSLFKRTGFLPVNGDDIVLETTAASIHGSDVTAYLIDRYVVGCRVKFYSDGDEGEIIGAFWVYKEDKQCLRMSFKVKYDNGEIELWSAAWLKAATACIAIPDGYVGLVKEQLDKRDALKEKYGIEKHEK